MNANASPRRSLMHISFSSITCLCPQNPLLVAWWSAAFPGFGHFLLNQYLRGLLLTVGEVVVNSLANINDALVYSFSGRFELARQTLDLHWAFIYMLIYMFSIWDSYIGCHSINTLHRLAVLENAPIPAFSINSLEIQYLEQRNPITAAIASFIFPGVGQLYNHRTLLGFYSMFWWSFFSVSSHVHLSVFHLFHGNLQASSDALQVHWLLFMPSALGGAVYNCYMTSLAHNRLFQAGQRQYLAKRYGKSDVCLIKR